MPIVVSMHVPSAVATRSVGENDSPLPWLSTRRVGDERRLRGSVRRLRAQVALVERVDRDGMVFSSRARVREREDTTRRRRRSRRRAREELARLAGDRIDARAR
jgi:hypothetical protein